MAWTSKSFNHPAFGPCELVPMLVAIKWVNPLSPGAVASALSPHPLTLDAGALSPKEGPSVSIRDPRPVNVNQSETLTWASGRLTDAALGRLRSDSNVEWVAPVYRPTNAVADSQSYFASNPKVLFLTQETIAAIGDTKSIDESASIDQSRSKLQTQREFLRVCARPQSNTLDSLQKSGLMRGSVRGT
jgi:hypothetical protein